MVQQGRRLLTRVRPRSWPRPIPWLVLGAVTISALWARPSDPARPLPPEIRPRVDAVLEAANLFRSRALSDYREALARYATPAVQARFETLDRILFPGVDPRIGWSLFMTVSPHTVGGILGTQPLVAFYDPWADVFLVTQWQVGPSGARLIDAEIVLGELIRAEPEAVLEPGPLWMRIPQYRPAALALATTSSMTAFETRFGSDPVWDWRGRLADLDDPDALALDRHLAGSLMRAHLRDVAAFPTPQVDEEPRLPGLRRLVQRLQAAAAADDLGGLLREADDTLPEVRQILQEADLSRLGRSWVVEVLFEPDQALVFLAPIDRPDFVVTLLTSGTGAALKLDRIDVVSYQGSYEYLSQLARQPPAARSSP